MQNLTPRQAGFAMPAEWALHKRTWMMWPTRAEVWDDMAATKRDYAAVAHAIREFEPVTMAVRPADMAEAFAAEGWDVLDTRRKPLRMLAHWALPLALAMRGVAGALPFHAEPDRPVTDWGSNLKAEATRFRKR